MIEEANMQSGDGEAAVCHVCNERFETQEDLAKHLMDTHPDDLLPNVTAD
jgi:hypothetical protein